MNRVVITGMGIYSTIGKNLEEVRDSLYHGKSGIVLDPYRKELQFRSGLTGAIERPVLKGVLPRRMRVGLPEQGEYAYLATMEALHQAKMDEDFLTAHEVGILYGNDSSAVPVVEATDIIREKQGTMRIGSGSIFQSMNSTVTMNLSVILKLKGINFTVSAACASGSHSIGMGYILIKQGMQDAIICGGAQEINALSMGSFDALNAFSVREDAPQKASRPFDRDRDGLVPSGGAATIVLENYETAIRRGAPIFGEVLGYGFSSNGEHISVPNVDGPKRSLEMALKDARVQATEIDYLNAHATSTPVGDTNEAQAIFTVFNQGRVPVSSTKSMTGHEMWMGGTSEVIYSLIMAHNSFIAPNINFENPDEHSKKLNIISKTTEQKIHTFLSNSFGFGGTNSTLIIRKLKR
ncbi:MAG: beta-ketoacyl-[acyl-carrier-protein] synthase family protein [Bacteroidales bacterium]|nr:beta-ketoacyl-[acyl-carrier-protein] synthase family protein [Bacteroidales bacterium]